MKRLIVSILIVLFSGIVIAEERIPLIVPNDVFKDYKKLIKGKSIHKITDFSGEGSRRDTVEVILVQQALRLGGLHENIRFVKSPNYTRYIKDLKDGKAALTASSMPGIDLQNNKDQLYASYPMIRAKEFEAGFYTVKTNKKALSAKTVHDIRQLTALSNRRWKSDWKTLKQLKFKKLLHTGNWSSMVKMVHKGRADFLLAPFQPTGDMSFEAEGILLVPVPNLKIGIMDSRYYGISKRYPKGAVILEALNRGLTKLRKKGLIRKAYRDSGFFNSRVSDWILVNDAVE